VYLTGINQMALTLHPLIFDFDAELRASSDVLANITEDAQADVPLPAAEGRTAGGKLAAKGSASVDVPVPYDLDLFEKLKRWRMGRAKSDQVSAFIIAHNTLLEELARRKPQTAQSLLGVKGFGQSKLDKYGAEILAILQAVKA